MTGERNPYVGPRTFGRVEERFFFGRETEARELAHLAAIEQVTVLVGAAGVGKSSLLHARLITRLQAEGYIVLPVGRVSAAIPTGVVAGETINSFVFALLRSLNPEADPDDLAWLTIADFVQNRVADQTRSDSATGISRPHVLIIDQLEEIFHDTPERWSEREVFFDQLGEALVRDPLLSVILSLREEYIAQLDQYAGAIPGRLRARYRLQRMTPVAAIEAIRRPAELAGRPFAPGVAEKLVEDLRQVRLLGQEMTVPGQYVEPVQLQVVCYQLWERLQAAGVGGQEPGVRDQGEGQLSGEKEAAVGARITEADLAAADDVNQVLEQFYTDTLAAVLAEPVVQRAGVSERALRTWFDKELLTESGIRNTVLRNESSGHTGSLPNAAVDALARRFLLRSSLRSSGAWVELVHDRLVEPIRVSNAVWFPEHLSTLQRQADLWRSQGRPDGLLCSGEALVEAERWAAVQAEGLEGSEQEFLAACQAKRTQAERERRDARRIRILAAVAVGVAIIAVIALIIAVR